MHEITPFDFSGHNVRVIMIDGEPWWVVLDVCQAMGIANSRDAASRIKPQYVGQADVHSESRGQNRPTNIVNEAGLMQLIMRSDVPAAEAFQQWVYEDVLPQIRRTGAYSAEPADDLALARQMIRAIEADRARLTAIEVRQSEQEAAAHAAAQARARQDDVVESLAADVADLKEIVPHVANGKGHDIKAMAHALNVPYMAMHAWLRSAGITYKCRQTGNIRPYAPWITARWARELLEPRTNGSRGADWVTYFSNEGFAEVARRLHSEGNS